MNQHPVPSSASRESSAASRELADWLQQRYPSAKRQTLKRMVAAGRVTINGRPAGKLSQAIRQSDEIRVEEQPDQPSPPRLPFVVVHEDEDLLVIDKPAGLLTSTTPRERRTTAIALVRDYVERGQPKARVGVIHRLDREASGLLVFSKNAQTFTSLKSQFFHHTVQRVYLAATAGIPQPRAGRIETHLVELVDGSVHSTRRLGKGEQAITDYQVVAEHQNTALVRVTLQTGRKHQIRAHLSERGTPIVGDPVYGGPPALRLMLVAILLAFDHPRTGKRMRFEVPPPKAIVACLRQG